MNFGSGEITLLNAEQIYDFNGMIKKNMGAKCAITDFAILLGGFVSEDVYVNYDNSLKGHTGNYNLMSSDGQGNPLAVDINGSISKFSAGTRTNGVRPTILDVHQSNSSNGITRILPHRFVEIEYGEYPQYVVSSSMEYDLEQAYQSGTILKKTGKTYTTDSIKCDDKLTRFYPMKNEEFEYNGRKYVRVYNRNPRVSLLSNGEQYKNGDIVWIEVSPLKWYVDNFKKVMLSKNIIASGIRFNKDGYFYSDSDWTSTDMYDFLNTYFVRDIVSSKTKVIQANSGKTSNQHQKEIEKVKNTSYQYSERSEKNNPYGFNFGQVSEEEIIKGAIASRVPVFLHGASSEGKSARVKQIDPDCVIIYLRNATPESLNGKSAYNSEKGEMIDIKPTWLKKLEAKCEAEPDKLHIVFFDEITNALPSIQGIAFNIILDREVNGIWQLPDNARIVAAGNEMKDSLSANQLAEPLFNRFAHVYIRTTTDGWLKWASEHNIHPAIYSYIAYRKGAVLRSQYNGVKPNADPRKWEMASKMLYATGSPGMLRALVGEDITREFLEFCNQPVITLNDVINGTYSGLDIQSLNTASRYATTMGLSQVDEKNMAKVRSFVISLGAEFGAIFDSLWSHGDESRLELIAEARLAAGGRKK